MGINQQRKADSDRCRNRQVGARTLTFSMRCFGDSFLCEVQSTKTQTQLLCAPRPVTKGGAVAFESPVQVPLFLSSLPGKGFHGRRIPRLSSLCRGNLPAPGTLLCGCHQILFPTHISYISEGQLRMTRERESPPQPFPYMDQAETPLESVKSQTLSKRASLYWKELQRLSYPTFYFTDARKPRDVEGLALVTQQVSQRVRTRPLAFESVLGKSPGQIGRAHV